MDKPDGKQPDKRCPHSPAALSKPGALHKIIPFLQLLNKMRDILNAVLVIPVYGKNALISALQGPRNAHAQLCPLPPAVLLYKQGIYPEPLQPFFLCAPIR